ncbi:phasin family protein [Legionella clemsonensis]|uniref:Phasin protein n=1 Tax=Legionella clemsonensis TaxID=1867846 RepID=A0A222NZ26_9GAMM|nr:phasin family protein [Legionella clemsonensis]ASQ44831.1 Phasin protein [Legionella clemsonensis]
MNQRYLEQWSEIARHIQKPFQEMFELNLALLKEIKFLKAEDLLTIKSPEEFIEKQVNLAFENGHKALNYFRQSFAIFEQTLKPITETVKNSSKSTLDTAKTLKSLLDPTRLAMAPTRAAIDITKPLLDPALSDSSFDPRRAMAEIANLSSNTGKAAAKKAPSGSKKSASNEHLKKH